jgi:hypothetical protein
MKKSMPPMFQKAGEPMESKKIQRAEVGYLKKGGAPKKLVNHEVAEHKKMNMKKMGRGR